MRERLRKFLKVLPFLFGGSLGMMILGIGTYELTMATESPAFCGQICHEPMYPEYTTYQASPHSNVKCSNCHVGAGSYNLITSKLNGLTQIMSTVTGEYERPIPSPVENLRPPRETCEKCHTPEKFSGNLVRVLTSYQADESNTKETHTLVLKVGGGESTETEGIHWHILSKVWYLPLDEKRLEIGWVGVENNDGSITEYINPKRTGEITAERLSNGKRLTDCVDCHNRATHIFRSPDELIDKALSEGTMDANIPFIKREGLKALDPLNPSLEEAYTKIEAIRDFYKTVYPAIYDKEKEDISKAISELKEVAKLTTFPEMKVNWKTHPDHSAHNEPPPEMTVDSKIDFSNWRQNESAGCFRCHGTLQKVDKNQSVSAVPLASYSGRGETLDAKCNLCHYAVSSPSQNTPLAKTTPHSTEGLEDCLLCHDKSALKPFPKDHPWSTNAACTACHEVSSKSLPFPPATPNPAKATTHTVRGLEDCLVCHGKSAPKPVKADHPWSTNDTCAACHQAAPASLPFPSATPNRAKAVPHTARGLENCLACHGKSAPVPIAATHPWSTNATCTACHQAASKPLPFPPTTSLSASAIPHVTVGLENCLLCHSQTSGIPFPADHSGRTNSLCTLCHKPAPKSTLTPTPTPTPAPTPTPINTAQIYASKCAVCHGVNRQGGTAPALTPTSLASRTIAELNNITANGLGSMPGYSNQLTPAEIKALSEWLKSTPP